MSIPTPVLAVLLSGVVASQQPADEKKPCKLEGRVVNSATGDPVRKVTLALTPASGQGTRLTATTDAEGRFALDNLEPGTYRLTAERAGFLRQEYGARSARQSGTPLTCSAGQEVRDLEFKLLPQGIVSGKVLDEDGEPVPRAQVSVGQQQSFGGRRRMMNLAGMSSDDLGEFRIGNLAPGRYFLSASFRSMAMFGSPDAPRPKTDKPEEDYVPTFYPGVTDPAAAVPIEIAPGQQVSGITIQLRKSRVFRIRGRLAGSAAEKVRVMLMPRERMGGFAMGFFGGAGGMVKSDGSFEIGGVQPGSYHVVAMSMEGRSQTLGRAPVDVTNGNVDGLVITVGSPIDLTGSVRVEGDEKVQLDRGRISLAAADGIAFNAPNATVKPDGSFQLAGVSRDRYRLGVYFPDGTYVKAARMGGQDVLDQALDLAQLDTAPPIEIVLSTKPGSVEGSVQADGKPAAGSFVTLIPDPPRPEQPYLYKTANTDQTGRFSIKNVAPGAYKLYAWEEPQYGAFLDPDFAKPFETRGVKVTISENTREQADLTLLK